MEARSDESSVEVTLMRSKANGNVLFLDARKDFIDILLSFLTLPAGAITKLLSEGKHAVLLLEMTQATAYCQAH